MTKKEIVLDILKKYAVDRATDIQNVASTMTGTQLYDEEAFIPDFAAACELKNMIDRKIGFTCKSPSGRIVRLIQPYDSTIYTGEPEELPAQWGFKWSTDPKKALPFIAISTSPYMKDDCCIDSDNVYRSKYDNNVHSPSEWAEGWELVE